MYAAYAGIRQSKIRHPEIISSCAGTEGGSVKNVQNLNLSLNCAETVRPSDRILESINMQQCIRRPTVKTTSFYVKRLILEKIFFPSGVRRKLSIFCGKACTAWKLLANGPGGLCPPGPPTPVRQDVPALRVRSTDDRPTTGESISENKFYSESRVCRGPTDNARIDIRK